MWLRVYTLAFIFATLTSIAVSAVLPAAGAWPYYGLTAADSRSNAGGEHELAGVQWVA